MNQFYIAKDIVTGRFLCWRELYDDGFGILDAAIQEKDIDFSDNSREYSNHPYGFQNPELLEYLEAARITGHNGGWRTAPRIKSNEIKFYKVSISISEVN